MYRLYPTSDLGLERRVGHSVLLRGGHPFQPQPALSPYRQLRGSSHVDMLGRLVSVGLLPPPWMPPMLFFRATSPSLRSNYPSPADE